MALLRSVLGTITQSFGGVTATTWKGKNVLKQKVAERNTSNTPAQALQRSKFAKLAVLGGLFGPSIRLGYRVAASNVTEQNAFYTANKDAIYVDAGDVKVNYDMLKMSQGIVGGVSGLVGHYVAATGVLSITHTDNSNGADALPTDRFVVAAIDTTSNTVAQLDTGYMRSEVGSVITLNLPKNLDPDLVMIYAFFKRATSTATSPTTAKPAIV